jgi:ferredoxin-NADP reductase
VAGAALLGRLTWQTGTVVELVAETPRARTIVLELLGWPGHLPGQHVDIRLTAEDGYQAQRSYSIASAPEDERLELTVERLDDGEVSPFLVDELRAGDELELRGPIGGYFVWEAPLGGPLLLVAGGSGVVPFRAMLRHRAAAGSEAEVRLVYSARSLAEVLYRSELDAFAADGVDVRLALTREWPDGWTGHRGRVDEAFLREAAWPPDRDVRAFVCGSTGFVETVAAALVALGYAPERVKTERFGATGGS